MGCAGIVALTLPGDPLQAVHPPLAKALKGVNP
jgi:hypothetical protein